MKSELLPENVGRDFTASALVIREDKILLLNHKKIDVWLQPGGHIEANELPHETAKRETKEETGFKVQLEGSIIDYDENAYDLPTPISTNVHKIKENHWHCDFIFKAFVDEKVEATHEDEHDGIKWFSLDEFKSGEYDMPENLRLLAIRVLEDL